MLQVSYQIVDRTRREHPELQRDLYWDQVVPDQLLNTAAAEPYQEEHPQPSEAEEELSSVEIYDHPVSLCKYFRN
jgi:hypothetical protein